MVFHKEDLSALISSFFTCLNFLSFYPTPVDLSLLTISWSTLNPLLLDLTSSNLTSMDALTLFNSDCCIILSCTKSVRVLFERRKSNRLKPRDFNYNGQVITSSSSVKFLGITFDSALTFRSHFCTVATLACQLLPLLPVITSLNWTLSSLQPMAPLPRPSSASKNPSSVHCLITMRQLHV